MVAMVSVSPPMLIAKRMASAGASGCRTNAAMAAGTAEAAVMSLPVQATVSPTDEPAGRARSSASRCAYSPALPPGRSDSSRRKPSR